MHVEIALAPVAPEYLPARHSVQMLYPADGEYVPGLQGVQALEAVVLE